MNVDEPHDPHHEHKTDAEVHHHDTVEDVADARVAVIAAVEAVKAADRKMDSLFELLSRHFRLGVFAICTAILVGIIMLYLIMQIKDGQRISREQSKRTELQAIVNEVEVLRHRVHSKESDLRLCTVALGASRGAEAATQICAPVLGDEYEATKAKLKAEETRLERLRRIQK